MNENQTIVYSVALHELEQFRHGSLYVNSTIKPISPERVKSYINNPHVLPSDKILFYIADKQQIIAFRTILPDRVMIDGKALRFGWCSGVWVHPEQRRKNLSTLMMKDALVHWENRLMFTNYAPASEKVYLNSGLFKLLVPRVGQRFYRGFSLRERFGNGKSSLLKNAFFALADIGVAMLSSLKSAVYRLHKFSTYRVEEPSIDQLSEFLLKIPVKKALFARGTAEISWVLGFPWLVLGVEKDVAYPFSRVVDAFCYKLVSMSNSTGQHIYFILFLRERRLKLLYHFGDKTMQLSMMQYVANYCYDNKVKDFTLFQPELVSLLKQVRTPFLYSKTIEMHIYSSFDVDKIDNYQIFDGDGDYCFS